MNNKVMGKWIIDKKLGSGSMGTVYLVHDPRITTQVRALKVVHPELAQDKQFQARFFKEFEVLESLRHPNILLVYDYLEEADSLVLVNEYLEGRSLKEELEATGKGLPWKSLHKWMLQVLLALAYAHSKNIIHRDIKPSNLFLCKDGSLKVIDFGLAKKLGDSSASITIAGQLVGTPAYLAPELADQKPHPGSDIYALGATVYHLLTGKLPFDTSTSKGDPILAMLKAHWTQTPPNLREVVPEIPETFVAAIEKAMQKEPDERFSSATDMALDIEKVKFTLEEEETSEKSYDPTNSFMDIPKYGEPIPGKKSAKKPGNYIPPLVMEPRDKLETADSEEIAIKPINLMSKRSQPKADLKTKSETKQEDRAKLHYLVPVR